MDAFSIVYIKVPALDGEYGEELSDNGYPKMTVHSNESEFSTEEFEYPSDRVEDDILELLHSVTVEQ
ncbi:hypothetical protein X798_04457 [Onchocerca flexuosa]|uniref:Uncharacterized protein n=1 Tax=Onchocerca flexuosa TaxID=387005 RepID=A0A238BTA0_9BILA|nr:hypothetical protein X798_04457 [Onchocerca flexuosa]